MMMKTEKLEAKLKIALESLSSIIEQGARDGSDYADDETEADLDFQYGVERGRQLAALEAEGAITLIEDLDDDK